MTLKFLNELTIGSNNWVYKPFRFNVNYISYIPSYRDVTVTGCSPLNLSNAEADGLRNIKLYGLCEQTGMPAPTTPIPILCNNGAVGSTGYTVVGSPTISSNLVVSGFSDTGYIKTKSLPSLLGQANSWEIDLSFTTPSDVSNIVGVLFEGNTNWCQILRIGKTGHPTIMQLSLTSTGNSYDIASYKDIVYVTADTTYWVKIIFTGTEYLCKYSTDNINFTTVNVATSSAKIKDNSTALNVGINKNANPAGAFKGTIDLKEFKIIVDDVPIRSMELAKLNNTPFFARDLLSCGENYIDEQNVTTGTVTRKVGYKIFDGTENWTYEPSNLRFVHDLGNIISSLGTCKTPMFCTHYQCIDDGTDLEDISNNSIYGDSTTNIYIQDNRYTDVTDFKNWLATQFAAGTPVIVTYPLAAKSTSSVAAQNHLQTIEGSNTLRITQAAINNLSLSARYSKTV